jgi:hypothetical protein
LELLYIYIFINSITGALLSYVNHQHEMHYWRFDRVSQAGTV